MVQDSIERYNNCESTAERALVVQGIIDSIYAIGGRFLKEDKAVEQERVGRPTFLWIFLCFVDWRLNKCFCQYDCFTVDCVNNATMSG
jgi:hypothetical protein